MNSKEHQSQTKWESTIPKWKIFIHQLHQLHLPWSTSLFGHPKNVQDLGSDLKEVTLSFSEEQEDALRLYGLAGGLRPKIFFPSFLWRKIWFLVENSWIQSRIYDIIYIYIYHIY